MNPFIRRLVRLGDISADEQNAILEAMERPTLIKKGSSIVHDGDKPTFSLTLLSGVAFRYKDLGDGRRQILCFKTPGDGIDLYGYALKRLDHGVCALTDCMVARLPHHALDALIARYPRLALTLWRETILDGSIIREQMVRIGQRAALERTANLLCEIAHRLDGTELDTPVGYHFPISQATLAQALGMSTIHVNRIVKKLRDEDLAVISRMTFKVCDMERLAQIGKFKPDYLEPTHLTFPPDSPAATALHIGQRGR